MTVAPGLSCKPDSTGFSFFFQRPQAVLKFIGDGLVKGQIELFDGRHAVPPQACLGKGGDLMCKLYGGFPGVAFWDHPIDQPHLQRFA